MTYLFAGAGLLLAVQTLLLWRVIRVTGEMRLHDQRLGRFGEALALLTETAESGFQAIGSELSRLAMAGPLPAPRQTSARRVVTSTRMGRTGSEIAADAHVSHGEVRLRLQLADLPPHESVQERVMRTSPGTPAPPS